MKPFGLTVLAVVVAVAGLSIAARNVPVVGGLLGLDN